MLGIGGIEYTFDLDALDKLIITTFENQKIKETETKELIDDKGVVYSKEIITKEYDRVREIDMAKYETIRVLFEVVLSTQEEIDDELGIERALADLPLPFKLSFNTLLQYGIIKES